MSWRIAFVMPGFGVVERGAEVFVAELSRSLAAKGFDVTILSRRRPLEAAGSSAASVASESSDGGDRRGYRDHGAGVGHLQIGAIGRDTGWVNRLYSATRLGRKLLDTFFLDPLNLEWATASLSALPRLWRGRFDLVVIEGGLVGGWVGRFLRRFRGTPFVDIAHGNSPKWEGAFARRGPDRVVVFTRAAAEMIGARAPKAKIEVIPHGVDLVQFRPRESRDVEDGTEVNQVNSSTEAEVAQRLVGLERPVILAAGSLDRQKRIDLSIEAVARLGRGSLVVVGRGPEGAALDRLAADRLGNSRYLRASASHEEMPEWFRAADLFTLPSESESFGLVYIEAMACGLPSVAPDEPVRREVLGDAALFVDVGDVAAYAEAMERALERDWGALPRCRAESFPAAATFESYSRLFERLIG